MSTFHFVQDYERYVEGLIRDHPIDEAMSLAVGGSYKLIGGIEADIMKFAGLKNGHDLVDFACGSGRLPAALLEQGLEVGYLGIDVVEQLLAYARTKCPPTYRFVRNHALTLPADSASADYFSAFSIFTHLMHDESYLYLQEMARVLRPDGKIVLSFIEFADATHWTFFEASVEGKRAGGGAHLNQFIERNQLRAWTEHLGFSKIDFIDGTAPLWSGNALGQSIAIVTK